MDELILVFRNSGDAIAGERKLLDAGINAVLSALQGTAGKGICLRISSSDMGKARLLLGDSVSAVYSKTGKEQSPWDP